MPRVFLRQTMIALRARRQAYRIATDFLYEEPIDVSSFSCRLCGTEIRPRVVDSKGNVCCGVCGAVNRVPPHLRDLQPPTAALAEPQRRWRDGYSTRRITRRTSILLLMALIVALVLVIMISAMPPQAG